jgi:hypothetical protein
MLKAHPWEIHEHLAEMHRYLATRRYHEDGSKVPALSDFAESLSGVGTFVYGAEDFITITMVKDGEGKNRPHYDVVIGNTDERFTTLEKAELHFWAVWGQYERATR